jgi:hypothetical protein
MRRWPVHTELLPDESISSWLIRCALENGCDPLVLTGVVWPRWRVWTTDIDRGIPEERLQKICSLSGIERNLIQRAALSEQICLLLPGGLPKHGVWPWVQGLGARNRRYRGGLQYCPCCLAGDSKPYFRRHWRFSWNTGCLLHNVRLIDQCPRCLKPLQPHCLEAIQSTRLSVCVSCGFDLRHSPTEKVLPDAQSFQGRATYVVGVAAGEIAENTVPVDQWFEACRHLVGILRRSATFPDSALTLALKDSGVDTRDLAPESLNLQLELLPVSVRETLLSRLALLLRNLEPFSRNLRARGALANSVWTRDKRLPSALQRLFQELGQAERHQEQRAPRTPGTPRSTAVVLKSWARLKRKYGIT